MNKKPFILHKLNSLKNIAMQSCYVIMEKTKIHIGIINIIRFLIVLMEGVHMNKYIGFSSIIIGILNLYFSFSMEFNTNLFVVFAVSIIGILLSVLALTKFKTKLLGIIGLILNAWPIVYFMLLCLIVG